MLASSKIVVHHKLCVCDIIGIWAFLRELAFYLFTFFTLRYFLRYLFAFTFLRELAQDYPNLRNLN